MMGDTKAVTTCTLANGLLTHNARLVALALFVNISEQQGESFN